MNLPKLACFVQNSQKIAMRRYLWNFYKTVCATVYLVLNWLVLSKTCRKYWYAVLGETCAKQHAQLWFWLNLVRFVKDVQKASGSEEIVLFELKLLQNSGFNCKFACLVKNVHKASRDLTKIHSIWAKTSAKHRATVILSKLACFFLKRAENINLRRNRYC